MHRRLYKKCLSHHCLNKKRLNRNDAFCRHCGRRVDHPAGLKIHWDWIEIEVRSKKRSFKVETINGAWGTQGVFSVPYYGQFRIVTGDPVYDPTTNAFIGIALENARPGESVRVMVNGTTNMKIK